MLREAEDGEESGSRRRRVGRGRQKDREEEEKDERKQDLVCGMRM